MHIVHVSLRVKEEYIASFKAASIQNAQDSLAETGVARFDVLQQQGDPCKFLFVEIYHTPEDQIKHRETEHFKNWRAAAQKMIHEPYNIVIFDNIFPDNSGW